GPAGAAPDAQPGAGAGPLGAALARPWAVALTYLLIAIVLAALGWSGLWDSFSRLPQRVSPWFTLMTAVPACAVVLLKRRAPATGLACAVAIFAVDLLTVGGLVPLLAVLELLHAQLLALSPERRRRALGGVVALTAAVVIAALLFSGDLRVAVMIALQFGALLGFSYWYANSIAQSRELVELYRQRSEDAERLAALDREAAVQSERDRMARELHDVVAGHISAVAIRSEAALDAAGSRGDRTPEQRALRAVRDSSLEAHAALRSMIRVLRSGEREFEVPPGRDRLPELVAAANDSGVGASLVDEVDRRLPAPIDQAVGRVVQEALANGVRHASGSTVEVRVGEAPGEVRVAVVSVGGASLGRPALEGSGMGLQLLAERVRSLGGELSAGWEADGVWAVRAALPTGDAS
ncbi:MAG: histidine kinase, partial [Leucobacter sp.]